MEIDRRALATKGVAAVAALLSASAHAAPPNDPVPPPSPDYMSKDGKSLNVKRTFTDRDGVTHVGDLNLKGKPGSKDVGSLVPAGCTAFYESPAVSMYVVRFPGDFDEGFHTMVNQQHLLAFHADGDITIGCRDKTRLHLDKPNFFFIQSKHDDAGKDSKMAYETHALNNTPLTEFFVFLPADTPADKESA